MELSPSMADSISSSYESSSDRPLGDALLESDTHTRIIPGVTSTCAEAGEWTRRLTRVGLPGACRRPRASDRMVEGQAGPSEPQRGQVRAQHHPALPRGQQPSEKQGNPPAPSPRPLPLDLQGCFTTTPHWVGTEQALNHREALVRRKLTPAVATPWSGLGLAELPSFAGAG